jgi:hypothetical protein
MADLIAAARAVRVHADPDTITGRIAINYDFRPPHFDRDKGVDPNAEEIDIAAEALVPAVLRAVGRAAPVLPLSRWIERERQKREKQYGRGQGYKRLTADLLGIEYTSELIQKKPPAGSVAARFQALRRSLERSGEASKEGRKESHKGQLSEEYQRLIGDLHGGERGNPFVPLATRARRILRRAQAQLKILGDWTISTRFYRFAWKGTDLEPAQDFKRVWDNPRAFFQETLATIEETWLGGLVSPELHTVYGYEIIIELQ